MSSAEIVHADEPATMVPMAGESAQVFMLLNRAVERGADVGALAQLVELQERVARRQAELEFGRELAEFQNDCPSIHKSKSSEKANSGGGKFSFTYEDLDGIVNHVKPHLFPRGFSIAFDSAFDPAHGGKFMDVFCILRHRNGHQLRTKCSVPIDSSLAVGSQQKIGAALAYGKRYALIAALGLTMSDEEQHAPATHREPISQEQFADIKALMAEVGKNLNRQKFDTHFGIQYLEQLTVAQYPEAVRILEGLRKKGGAQ